MNESHFHSLGYHRQRLRLCYGSEVYAKREIYGTEKGHTRLSLNTFISRPMAPSESVCLHKLNENEVMLRNDNKKRFC